MEPKNITMTLDLCGVNFAQGGELFLALSDLIIHLLYLHGQLGFHLHEELIVCVFLFRELFFEEARHLLATSIDPRLQCLGILVLLANIVTLAVQGGLQWYQRKPSVTACFVITTYQLSYHHNY